MYNWYLYSWRGKSQEYFFPHWYQLDQHHLFQQPSFCHCIAVLYTKDLVTNTYRISFSGLYFVIVLYFSSLLPCYLYNWHCNKSWYVIEHILQIHYSLSRYSCLFLGITVPYKLRVILPILENISQILIGCSLNIYIYIYMNLRGFNILLYCEY